MIAAMKKQTHAIPTLEDCERRILAGTFSLCHAWKQVYDHHLYLKTHESFEQYCVERWQIAASTAHSLIRQQKVIGSLPRERSVPIPETQRQMRELSNVPPQKRSEVWKNAVVAAKDNGKRLPTGDDVRRAAGLPPLMTREDLLNEVARRRIVPKFVRALMDITVPAGNRTADEMIFAAARSTFDQLKLALKKCEAMA